MCGGGGVAGELVSKQKGLVIPQLNIRGIKPKRNELLSLLELHNVDIACLQETLLSHSINVTFPSFAIERADRPSITKSKKVGADWHSSYGKVLRILLAMLHLTRGI